MKLEKEFYTIQEVADLFEVTKPTVYDWMKTRGLAWVRLGARRRITRAAIEAFLKAGSDAGASEGYNPKGIRTPMSAHAFEPAR
jgi:excisionase family DNA binding protein